MIVRALKTALKSEFGNYEKFKERIPRANSFSNLLNWVLHYDPNTGLYRLYSCTKNKQDKLKLSLRDTFIAASYLTVELKTFDEGQNCILAIASQHIYLPSNPRLHKSGKIMRALPHLTHVDKFVKTIQELLEMRIEKMVMDHLYADEECFDTIVEISPDMKWAYGILLDRPTGWESWSRSGSYDDKSRPVDFDPIYLFRIHTEKFDWMPVLRQEHHKGVDVELEWESPDYLVSTREFASYYDVSNETYPYKRYHEDIVIKWSPSEDKKTEKLIADHFITDVANLVVEFLGSLEQIDPR